MSAHNILSELNAATAGGGKVIQIWGSGAKPASVPGYSMGCLLIIATGSDAGIYKNNGTLDSCDFVDVGTDPA